MRDRQTLGTSRYVDSRASSLDKQKSLSRKLKSVERVSYLGLPNFDWSLTLLGLCIFTFAIVTFYVPIAEIGIAVAIVGLLLGRDRVRVPFPVWLYVIFLLWTFAASFASPFPDIARIQVVERLKLLVVLLIAINALRTEGQLRFYLLFFLACFILFPVRGALMNYAAGYTVYGRALWNYIYNNPNDLAALSLIAFGIALALAMPKAPRTVVRLGAGISAILLFMVILLTQSRGAFIALMIATAPVLIPMLLKKPHQAIGAAFVALAIGLTIPANVWERLSSIQKLSNASTLAEADSVGSADERYKILQVGWQIWADHPVFGVGLGGYRPMNARYAPDIGDKDTHNTYLNLAAEIGLPGLLIWCVLIGSVLRYARRSRRRADSDGILATQQLWMERGLVGFLVAGIFGSFAALTFPYLLLAILWCSATQLRNTGQAAEGP